MIIPELTNICIVLPVYVPALLEHFDCMITLGPSNLTPELSLPLLATLLNTCQKWFIENVFQHTFSSAGFYCQLHGEPVAWASRCGAPTSPGGASLRPARRHGSTAN
ncbi:MAG: hypothetical protein ACR2PY_00695 [Salinispira sp.]